MDSTGGQLCPRTTDDAANVRLNGQTTSLTSHRAEDEYVRQALERGCVRDDVMAVLDISRRSTFYKEKRARAYDFPLAAIGSRNGGRPVVDDADDEDDAANAHERPEMTGEAQQRLDTVADGMGRDASTPVDGAEQTAGESVDEREQRDTQASRGQAEIHNHIQQAIAALQAIDEGLNAT